MAHHVSVGHVPHMTSANVGHTAIEAPPFLIAADAKGKLCTSMWGALFLKNQRIMPYGIQGSRGGHPCVAQSIGNGFFACIKYLLAVKHNLKWRGAQSKSCRAERHGS